MKTITLFMLLLPALSFARDLTVKGTKGHNLSIKMQSCGAFAFPEGDHYMVEGKDIECAQRTKFWSKETHCRLTIPDENGIMKVMTPHLEESEAFFEAAVAAGISTECRDNVCAIEARKITCQIFGVREGNMTYECKVSI